MASIAPDTFYIIDVDQMASEAFEVRFGIRGTNRRLLLYWRQAVGKIYGYKPLVNLGSAQEIRTSQKMAIAMAHRCGIIPHGRIWTKEERPDLYQKPLTSIHVTITRTTPNE